MHSNVNDDDEDDDDDDDVKNRDFFPRDIEHKGTSSPQFPVTSRIPSRSRLGRRVGETWGHQFKGQRLRGGQRGWRTQLYLLSPVAAHKRIMSHKIDLRTFITPYWGRLPQSHVRIRPAAPADSSLPSPRSCPPSGSDAGHVTVRHWPRSRRTAWRHNTWGHPANSLLHRLPV